MTVCVATLCESASVVFGASDRMLTASLIEFEPPQSKVWRFTTSIAAMYAGDAAVQREILIETHRSVSTAIAANPDRWVDVEAVARWYAEAANVAARRRSEAAILAPRGLSHETFISRQRELAPELVTRLAGELANYEPPGVEVIIAGVDSSGAHLYKVCGPSVSCLDGLGFASIGMGAWHAESQLMLARYTSQASFAQAFLATYSAKRHAEVAPGVGRGTDMFAIGPSPGTLVPVHDDALRRVDEIYEWTRESENRIGVEAREKAQKLVEDLIAQTAQAAAPAEQQATTKVDSSPAAPGADGPGGGAE